MKVSLTFMPVVIFLFLPVLPFPSLRIYTILSHSHTVPLVCRGNIKPEQDFLFSSVGPKTNLN